MKKGSVKIFGKEVAEAFAQPSLLSWTAAIAPWVGIVMLIGAEVARSYGAETYETLFVKGVIASLVVGIGALIGKPLLRRL